MNEEKIGINIIIFVLIGAGIGFAIGNYFHFLWGVYGAILGGSLTTSAVSKYYFKSYDALFPKDYKMINFLLVGVGVGFAIGGYFTFLWGVFGAILGGLIGFRIFMK